MDKWLNSFATTSVDNLRVHHAKILDKWLEDNSERIKLFYLPSYSPELNPDEYLNRDVKASFVEKKRPLTAKALKSDVVAHLSAKKERAGINQATIP